MANPKKKQTPRRGKMRRAHQKIDKPNLVTCEHCGKLKLSHRVCPYCGHYGAGDNLELIVPQKVKKDKKTNE